MTRLDQISSQQKHISKEIEFGKKINHLYLTLGLVSVLLLFGLLIFSLVYLNLVKNDQSGPIPSPLFISFFFVAPTALILIIISIVIFAIFLKGYLYVNKIFYYVVIIIYIILFFLFWNNILSPFSVR